MRLKLTLLAAVLALTTSGCAALANFLRAAFKPPTFAFKAMGLQDISLGGLTLDTTWGLNNPNSVGISLASVDYALFIENKQVVAGAPPKGLQIPARGAVDLHFPAAFRFQDIAGVVETFLNKDRATYRAEGRLGLQTPVGILQLPIAKEGDFEVPKIPQVAFGNPRVTNMSFNGATVEFPLNVTNKNSFPLPIGGVSGQLAIAGSNIGTLSTGDLGLLDGKGTRTLTLPLNINLMNAAGAAGNALRGGNSAVSFSANVTSGGKSLPLRVDQVVNFLR